MHGENNLREINMHKRMMFSIRLYRFGAYQNEMYIIYVIQTDRNQRKVLIMCKYELYHVSNKMH